MKCRFPPNEQETVLINEYERLWQRNKAPEWAYPIPPAISAIGSTMERRILSLASSENISKGYSETLLKIFKREGFSHVVSRSRWEGNGSYFPYRHISPFNKGDQFIITWFALVVAGVNVSYDITQFAEQICTANAIKFTLLRDQNMPNRDPTGGLNLIASKPYLIADLKVVKPEIIIIPRTRFNLLGGYREWVHLLEEAEIQHSVKFIFIEQAVPQRINTSQGSPVIEECRPIDAWIENCRCKKTMRGHLAFLKQKWVTRQDEWTVAIP